MRRRLRRQATEPGTGNSGPRTPRPVGPWPTRRTDRPADPIRTSERRTRALTALDDAARTGGRTAAAGRWWSGYTVLVGLLAFGLIVTVEAIVPSFGARLAATVVWAGAIGLLGMWARSHEVQPRGGSRRLLVAMAAWFGAYLVVIGPIVRWQAGTSVGWWSAAGAVMALPFLLGAWRQWRPT